MLPTQKIELKQIVNEGMKNATLNGYGEFAWHDADAAEVALDMYDFNAQLEEFRVKHSLFLDGFLEDVAELIREIRQE